MSYFALRSSLYDKPFVLLYPMYKGFSKGENLNDACPIFAYRLFTRWLPMASHVLYEFFSMFFLCLEVSLTCCMESNSSYIFFSLLVKVSILNFEIRSLLFRFFTESSKTESQS